MGVVVEELRRMVSIYQSPYFIPGIALLSAILGLLGGFFFIAFIFLFIFIEIIAWIIAVSAAFLAGFIPALGSDIPTMKGAKKGIITILAINVPRYFMMLLPTIFLSIYAVSAGIRSFLFTPGIVFYIVIFIVINMILGFILGAIGCYIGRNPVIRNNFGYIAQEVPHKRNKFKYGKIK